MEPSLESGIAIKGVAAGLFIVSVFGVFSTGNGIFGESKEV
jgi:hypothetical protein